MMAVIGTIAVIAAVVIGVGCVCLYLYAKMMGMP